jgi:acyl-CoA thioesterase
MAQINHKPFMEQLALKQTSEHEFEMINLPQQRRNALDIAYGSHALALACKAVCLTTPEEYHLYSLLGISPTYTDRPLHAHVRVIRQTCTFAIRQVEVSQQRSSSSGSTRICLIATADFQIPEKQTLTSYSRKPLRIYPPPSACPTQAEVLVTAGKITQEFSDYHVRGFSLLEKL